MRAQRHGPHQSQLKPMSAMVSQHANAAKIACIENVSGRDNAGKGDQPGSVKRSPPMPLVKPGHRSGIEESQLMKFR